MRSFKAMAAIPGNKSDLKRKDLVFEPKLDGYRILCYKENNKIRLISRNGNDYTNRFFNLRFEENIIAKNAVIDGEVIVYDKKGNPDFQLLQDIGNSDDAVFIAFDIVFLNNKDLTRLPLTKRKEILDRVIIEGSKIQKIIFTNDGEKLWKLIKKRNLEGVMGKVKTSTYEYKRSTNWIKIKRVRTLDCIILGYISKKRRISSLLLGIYEKNNILYIGNVGTGFNDKTLKELEEKFNGLILKKEKDITYLKPRLVCEVKYSEMTSDKKLRAPSFLRLRTDKDPKECIL